MKRKKGFTLIELLAVIVILAIILLIATPIILNVIEDTRIGAFKSSVKNISNTAEITYVNELVNKGESGRLEFYYNEKEETSNKANLKLNYKGEKPDSGYVYVSSQGKILVRAYNKQHKLCGKKEYNEETITVETGKSEEECIASTSHPTIELVGETSITLEVEQGKKHILGNGDYIAYESSGEPTTEIEIYVDTIKTRELDKSILNKEYQIVYKVTEGELFFEVSRSVKIVDTTKPVITIPNNTSLTSSQVSGYNLLDGVSAVDNSGETLTIQVEGSLSILSGSYQIKYSSTDSSGNKEEIIRIIDVSDNEGPIITIIGDNPVMLYTNASTYTDPGATAIDNVDGDVTSRITKTNNLVIGVEGEYQIVYRVVDNAGNESVATRRINIAALVGVKKVITRNDYVIYLMEDGTVKAVGSNVGGQLGDGTTIDKITPIVVPGLSGVKDVSAGSGHAVYLMEDGIVKVVGNNMYGQLGDGTTIDQTTVVTIPGLSGVKQISAGGSHTIFLMEDGTVKALGYNYSGQLGDGTATNRTTMITVPGLTGVKAVFAGAHNSFYLMEDGTVKAVGNNAAGQLGDGTTINKTTIITVPGLSGVKQIIPGNYHVFYLMEDGTVKAVGWNSYGQLGDGTTTNKTTIITVPGLSGVKGISTGSYHSVFLFENGTVKAVGINNRGQLGDGTKINRPELITIPNLNEVRQVASQELYTIYLMNNGSVKSTGSNDKGQLGDGTKTERLTPVDVKIWP